MIPYLNLNEIKKFVLLNKELYSNKISILKKVLLNHDFNLNNKKR